AEAVEARVEAGRPVRIAVDIEATGDRPSTDVVQVYVAPSGPGRPPKTLAGFTKVVTDPGSTTTAFVDVPAKALREWDDDAGVWNHPGGVRRFLVAASATDVRFEVQVETGEA